MEPLRHPLERGASGAVTFGGDDPTFGRLALELGARCVGTRGPRHRLSFQARAEERVAELAGRCPSASLTGELEVHHDDLQALAPESPAAACFLAALSDWSAPPPEPELMGVVNVTPDSFSDGGRFLDARRAIDHGLELADQGARWLDVGGESTRPGAEPVPATEELRRVLPVVEGLVSAGVARVSIDTRKAEVARAALQAGAEMVNDVGAGLDDEGMLPLLAQHDAEYCLMHRQGSIQDMQRAPRYVDPVAEVTEFLRQRAAACLSVGIAAERLHLDPGIGFGKSLEHNLALLRRLGELRSLGLPLLLGVSRKSFIGQIREAGRPASSSESVPDQRVGGTAAAISFCVRGGAKVLRVHDVAVMAEATAVARALETPDAP